MGLRPIGITRAHLKKANIPQDYWDCGFLNYRGPLEPKETTKKYLKNLREMKEAGIGILYVGPNGPGKTTLGMICMKYLARAEWDVYCISLGEIVEDIQKSWQSKEDSIVIGKCREADFLFIDDVGKEHRGQSGFVQTVFDNLIRYRVQHRYPTFLSSNFTKKELEITYGDSVMSLLEGKLLPVVVDGSDYRKEVLKSESKEAFK